MKYKRTLIILSILFILNTILVLTGSISIIDDFIYNIIHKIECDAITNIFKVITFLADLKFLIILNILIIGIIIKTHKKHLLLLPIACISSGIINSIVKHIIRRERPNVIHLVVETSYSYPSGHSMASMLCYASIIYLINKYNIKHKKLFTILLSMLILSIGITRIYFGVHFFSDILGGYILGLIVLIILININEHIKKKKL